MWLFTGAGFPPDSALESRAAAIMGFSREGAEVLEQSWKIGIEIHHLGVTVDLLRFTRCQSASPAQWLGGDGRDVVCFSTCACLSVC